MARVELQPAKFEKHEVDHQANLLRTSLMRTLSARPDFREAKAKVDRGIDVNYDLILDENTVFRAVFVFVSEANNVQLTLVTKEADGLHQKVGEITTEKPIARIWKFYDLSKISFQKNGTTVFDSKEAVQGIQEIINTLK